MDSDQKLRNRIYTWFVETGRAPDAALVESWCGDHAALKRLHDDHQIVLDSEDRRQIRMALPFAAVPTQHVVRDPTNDV